VAIEEKAVYTVEQVAELLSRSEESIRRLLRKGELKGFHLGRRWYVRGESLLSLGSEVEEPKPRDKRKGGEGGELVLRKQAPRAKPKRAAKPKPPNKAKASVVDVLGRLIPKVVE
jgi:hypothetical protein